MAAPTAACVLHYGGDFAVRHVDALFAGVEAAWSGPLRFVCLTTEVPERVEIRPLTRGWLGWWSKMELFAPEHDDLGDLLYFDLDTLIVGSLADVAAVGRATMLRDFYKPTRLASGMMYLPVAMRQDVWRRWQTDPPAAMRAHRRFGDGGFLDALWRGQAATWQDQLPGQVVSYKVDVRPRADVIPAAARVVCFHGKPRPWDTALWIGALQRA